MAYEHTDEPLCFELFEDLFMGLNPIILRNSFSIILTLLSRLNLCEQIRVEDQKGYHAQAIIVSVVFFSLIGNLNHSFDVRDAAIHYELVLQFVLIDVLDWRNLGLMIRWLT